MRRAAWLFGVVLAGACADAAEPAAPAVGPDAAPAPIATVEAGTVPDAGPVDASASGDATPVPVDCRTLDFCRVDAPLSPLAGLNAVWGQGPDDVWAVGSRGTVLHREGGIFVSVPADPDAFFFAASGVPGGAVWLASSTAPYRIVPAAGGFVVERQLGANFADSTESRPLRLWSLSAGVDGALWLGGNPSGQYSEPFESAALWRSDETDAGLRWLPVAFEEAPESDTPTSIRAVWTAAPDRGWAVGAGGQTFRREPPADPDAGAPAPWRFVAAATDATLEAVWGSSAGDVWAVGAFGTIQRLDASGAWQNVASPTFEALHGIWGSGPADVWAVGDAGVVLHFDGSSWSLARTPAPSSITPAWYGVWGSGANDVWVVGATGILHHTAENGATP